MSHLFFRSHRFFRAFYIPFVSHKFCTYGSYNLLQNIKFKSIPLLSKEKNTKFSWIEILEHVYDFNKQGLCHWNDMSDIVFQMDFVLYDKG